MVEAQNERGFVVVTGTSTGIGAATVSRLSNNGFHVFAGVRRAEDAEALRTVADGAVTPLLIELTDPALIDAAAPPSRRWPKEAADKPDRSRPEPPPRLPEDRE